MTCKLCTILRQVAENAALILDKGLNTALLGSPNETLSRRTARAREAGSKGAVRFCAFLTFVFNLFGTNRDHCTWALEPGTIGAEVWHWSPPISSQEPPHGPLL